MPLIEAKKAFIKKAEAILKDQKALRNALATERQRDLNDKNVNIMDFMKIVNAQYTSAMSVKRYTEALENANKTLDLLNKQSKTYKIVTTKSLSIHADGSIIQPRTRVPQDSLDDYQWETSSNFEPWSELGPAGAPDLRPQLVEGCVRLRCGDIVSNRINIAGVIRREAAIAKRATYRYSDDDDVFIARCASVASRILGTLRPKVSRGSEFDDITGARFSMRVFHDRVMQLPERFKMSVAEIVDLCNDPTNSTLVEMVEFCEPTIRLNPNGMRQTLRDIYEGKTIQLKLVPDTPTSLMDADNGFGVSVTPEVSEAAKERAALREWAKTNGRRFGVNGNSTTVAIRNAVEKARREVEREKMEAEKAERDAKAARDVAKAAKEKAAAEAEQAIIAQAKAEAEAEAARIAKAKVEAEAEAARKKEAARVAEAEAEEARLAQIEARKKQKELEEAREAAAKAKKEKEEAEARAKKEQEEAEAKAKAQADAEAKAIAEAKRIAQEAEKKKAEQQAQNKMMTRAQRQREAMIEEYVRNVFETWDTDESQGLSRSEIRTALEAYNRQPGLTFKILDLFDENSDEVLSFEEFQKWVRETKADEQITLDAWKKMRDIIRTTRSKRQINDKVVKALTNKGSLNLMPEDSDIQRMAVGFSPKAGELSQIMNDMSDQVASEDDELQFAMESEVETEDDAAMNSEHFEFAESSAAETDSDLDFAESSTVEKSESNLEFAESSAAEKTASTDTELDFAESSAVEKSSVGHSTDLDFAESSAVETEDDTTFKSSGLDFAESSAVESDSGVEHN